ncbi:hypothetical protein HY251_20000 [bacterium]|nr:hypothetical protein [bacterium]
MASSGGDAPSPRVGPPPAPTNWASTGDLPTPLPALTPGRFPGVPGDDSSTALGPPSGLGLPGGDDDPPE